MVAVVGLDDAELNECVQEARAKCPGCEPPFSNCSGKAGQQGLRFDGSDTRGGNETGWDA